MLGDLLAPKLPAGTNLIDGPTPQLKPPAVVLRPDNPWLEPASPEANWCIDQQRYLAIPVVTASTPGDGVRVLYSVVKAIKNALAYEHSPWSWESVSAPVVDESTGTAFLATSIRIKYLNSEEEEEEST